MATAVAAMSVSGTVPRTTSSLQVSQAPSAVPAASSQGLTDDQVQKMLNCDKRTLKAALVIRKWVKIALQKRLVRKLAIQFAAIQAQHDAMMADPQRFQDCDLMSLIQLSPLCPTAVTPDVDPFAVVAETIDALIRAELKKHASKLASIKDTAKANEMKTQLQQVEASRREILQVYALRQKTKASKPVSVPKQLPKQPITPAMDENSLNSAPKPRKLKRSRSLTWADAIGKDLTSSQTFNSEDLVTPPNAVKT